MRKCLDLIIFNSGDKKDVKADRFKTGSAGKLALFGQGNCHGVSSTMAAFLYPYRNMLGIDLKYRGGTSSGANNTIEEHQWLELTFRPSMKTYVCDIWYEGINHDSRYLCMPIKEAYQNLTYPNGRLIIGTKIQPLSKTDTTMESEISFKLANFIAKSNLASMMRLKEEEKEKE